MNLMYYVQNLIACPDGTMADPLIGCVRTPATVVNPESGLIAIILKIAAYVNGSAAAIATVFVIIGAIRYAMAAGDPEQIDKAKRTIFWSLFGLILSLLAVFVAQFIAGIINS